MPEAQDQYNPQQDHDPYAALRHRDYRRLLTGNVLAGAGAEMVSMAVGWELFQRTNSALALAFVGLVQFLPVLVLALPAGHAADRYSRKLLMIAAQGGITLAGLGLAVISYLEAPVLLVYVCLLILGICRAYSAPARWSLVPLVVPEAELANAITWNSSGWQIASMVGPALGGAVIALTGGAAAAYVLAALGSLACLGLVATIRPRTQVRHRKPISLASLLAGLGFVYRTKLILATLTLDLFAVLLGGATTLLPVFAKEILDVGPVGLGWLRAAPSMGALVMALTLAHRPPLSRAGPTLLWAVAGFGVATIVFGLSRDAILSFLMLALIGALDNISVVVRGTLVQVLTPDAMRGRVSAVNAIFIVSSNELGGFESGLTAHWFGPVWSVVGGGIGTLAVVVTAMVLWPQLLRLGSLHHVRPEEIPLPGPAVPAEEPIVETRIQELKN
jgi:MFS family permease